MSKKSLTKITIKPSDLRWEHFRSGGSGGQHQNKTESGARVRWYDPVLDIEFVAESRESRSQHENKRIAQERLVEKVKEAYKAESDRQKAFYRKENSNIGFGTDQRVRTYNEAKNYIRNEETGTMFPYDSTMGKNKMQDVIEEQTQALLMEDALKRDDE